MGSMQGIRGRSEDSGSFPVGPSMFPEWARQTAGFGRRGLSARMLVGWLILWSLPGGSENLAQDAGGVQTGVLIDVPVPLTDTEAARLIERWRDVSAGATGEGRRTVVLRHRGESDAGAETAFETALKVARAMTSTEFRRLKFVSWVQGEVVGHSTLPVLASDQLVMAPGAVLADAGAGEASADETVAVAYRSIAGRRALFPPAVVAALVDAGQSLTQVEKVGGGRTLALGEELDSLRAAGDVLREESWGTAGIPLRLDAKRLRDARIASQVTDREEQVTELLGLASLERRTLGDAAGEARGALMEIIGSIAPNRSRRWQSNLQATLDGGEVNTWLVSIDSHGGNLSESATLAAWFAAPPPPLRTVAGFVRGEARGDAALVALACKPLLIKPDALLGGPGADAIDSSRLADYDELIVQIARDTGRPESLIRGLLDRQSEVYRYTHRRTGRVRYATQAEIGQDAEDTDLERDRWERGPRIELADGLTAADAVELGLADGVADSLEAAARRAGLDEIPPPLSDRAIVRFVEQVGRSQGLAIFLLFVGFVMLSSEAGAPGLGIPGFLAMVCFAAFFWIKFLAGTAEWLELLAFALGILCIAIELFVLPGFGVFGIGGLLLTMLGVVLMSQTFVIPRNVYQLEVFTRGIWIALGSLAAMIGGLVLIRALMPSVPLFRGLVMETPDALEAETRERLADFTHLQGQEGVATTPLRPSGKARFGDELVAVVSDGTAIGSGEAIRVLEVRGNRVVVEKVESE